MVFWGVLGVYIIPKWLIKVPGHFGILFRWFRELRKFCQNLVPEPSGLLPTCLKKYKKMMESSWKNIIFVNLGHQNFRLFRNLYVLGTRFVSMLFRFVFVFFWIFLCFLSIYFENNFTKMRNWKWYIFHYWTAPQLGFEFHIYQKTWNGDHPKLSYFQGWYPKLF